MNSIDSSGITKYEDFKTHIRTIENETLEAVLNAVLENRKYYTKLIKELRYDLKNYEVLSK